MKKISFVLPLLLNAIQAPAAPTYREPLGVAMTPEVEKIVKEDPCAATSVQATANYMVGRDHNTPEFIPITDLKKDEAASEVYLIWSEQRKFRSVTGTERQQCVVTHFEEI